MDRMETYHWRLRAMDEGLEKVKMEDREKGPEGGCNVAGGSNISLQHGQRHKHTNHHQRMTVVFGRWSVWKEYSVATGTNTYCPGEVSDITRYSKLYTVNCMGGVLSVYVCKCVSCCVQLHCVYRDGKVTLEM